MSYLAKFRSNIEKLFAAYQDATGYKRSTISTIVARDPKFASTFMTRDMRVSTYDLVTQRFSAVWPANCPWPNGIERPEPAQVDDLPRPARARATDHRAIHPDWPEDRPWPADIPRPVVSQKHVSGPGA